MLGSFAHPGMSPQRSMERRRSPSSSRTTAAFWLGARFVARAKVQRRTRAAEAQEGMHFAPREALCESTAHASETTGDDRAGTSASRRVGTLIATRIVMEDGRARPPGTQRLRYGLARTTQGIVT